MPSILTQAAAADVVVDRANQQVRLERRLSAPPKKVFDAWTKAEQVAAWWDPAGEPLAECVIDLRPGGHFKFVSARHPQVPPFMGTYKEISPPGRLEFDALGASGRVLISATDGGSLLKVTIQCASREHFEQFLEMGVDKGTSQTLDNLVTYLAAD